MSEAELIFTALAELSTRQIAETDEAIGLTENAKAGKKVVRLLKMHAPNLKNNPARKLLPAKTFCLQQKIKRN